MEQLQRPNSPPTPSRHIHSSFPFYFYTTPAAAPSSQSISAFVALCEPRAAPSDSDVRGFAFAPADRHATSVAAAAAPAGPLKPPPRLQFIANLRKSLRSIPRMRKPNSRHKKDAAADPFATAAEKVRREDAPWCQLPWRERGARSDGAKAKSGGIMDSLRSLIPKRVRDGDRANGEESAVLIRQSSTSSGTGGTNNGNRGGLMSKSADIGKKENWFFRFLKSAIIGKGSSKGGLVYGPSMFACFGSK